MNNKHLGYDPAVLNLQVRHWVGQDEVMCTCPFHDDSDPSLAFNIKSGLFICYGCGARGTAAKLARQTGGYAYRTHVTAPAHHQDVEWLNLVGAQYAYDDPYLISRGVTNDQVERFGIKRHSLGIVVPLYDARSNLVGALMRKREGKVRYLTLGEKPPLWPLQLMRGYQVEHRGRFALVEGVFGVLAADRAGVPALATLGAAVKSDAGRYLAEARPLVLFDADQAGYIGAGRVLKLSPMATVVVPGVEADELTPTQWRDFWAGQLGVRTADIARLAALSGDRQRFYSLLPKVDGQFDRLQSRYTVYGS